MHQSTGSKLEKDCVVLVKLEDRRPKTEDRSRDWKCELEIIIRKREKAGSQKLSEVKSRKRSVADYYSLFTIHYSLFTIH